MYSISQRQLLRTIALNHWPTSMSIAPQGHLIAVGCKGEQFIVHACITIRDLYFAEGKFCGLIFVTCTFQGCLSMEYIKIIT